jgi:hypothetical protein
MNARDLASTMIRRLRPAFALLFLAAFSACYFPSGYEADLTIEADGKYAFRYVGELSYLPLLQKLTGGELSREEIRKQVDGARQDLARDKSFKEITFDQGAKFRVRYERQGDIFDEKSFNFVRFNARFFSIRRLEDGTVKIAGNRPPSSYLPQLRRMGLQPNGIFRVWTSAEAIDDNATAIEGDGKKVYAWIIADMEQPSPRLILRMP